MLQLTWRAVVMGSVLGGVLSLTNLYIGGLTTPTAVIPAARTWARAAIRALGGYM